MIVPHFACKDLHFAAKPSKSGGVEDTISIALEWSTGWVQRLRVGALNIVTAERRITGEQRLFTLMPGIGA